MNQTTQFKYGDRVKIRNTNNIYGLVVELRGPLGPNGTQVYRLLLRKKPKSYVEVREDQLILAPAGS